MKVIAIDNTGYKVSVIQSSEGELVVSELPKGIFHLTEPIELKVDEKKQPTKVN
jgi:hypothetical protein